MTQKTQQKLDSWLNSLETTNNVSELRNSFYQKIWDSKDLTDKEKQVFIQELDGIWDKEFLTFYESIQKNYQNIVIAIKLKWTISWIIEIFDWIERNLIELQSRRVQLLKHKEAFISNSDKVRAESEIDSDFII